MDTWLNMYDPDDASLGVIGQLRIRYDALYRPLIKFDLTPYIPPGSIVVDAKLYLWMYQRTTSIPMAANVYRVNRHWDDTTATWKYPWLLPGGDAVPGDREGAIAATTTLRFNELWYEWNLKDVVQQWVSDQAPNEGVVILGSAENPRESVFYSSNNNEKIRRPKLWVLYYPMAPTPTPTPTLTRTNTPTPTPTATGTPVPGRIEGRVWNDLNGDGVADVAEPGLAGATLRLMGTGQPDVVSGSDGTFAFANLTAAQYMLVEFNPPGYVSTTSDSVTVVVSSGVTTRANFGDWVPAPTPTGTRTPTVTITTGPTVTATATHTEQPTATATRTGTVYPLWLPIIVR